MAELSLAVAHHVLVFGLVAMLMVELAWTRPGMTATDAGRVARLDARYGATAGLIIIIGAARVIWGGKGSLYYVENPWFWAKIASFVGVGLMSIPPTLRFLAWRRRLRASPDFAPLAKEATVVRRYLLIQVVLILAVLGFAAATARHAG